MKKTISFRAEPNLHNLLNDFVIKTGMKKFKVIELALIEYITINNIRLEKKKEYILEINRNEK